MMRELIFAAVFLCLVFPCSASPDYSSPDAWAYYAEGNGDEADLFIIAPTVDMGADGNMNMSLSDEKTKGNLVGALNMERGIFEDSTVMYSPFYRQMTFPVYAERISEEGEHLDIAYGDIREAFIYYLENINDGRPFILAGFSQGGQMTLMLLKEFFDEEELADQLIAAYVIGWRITDEDLEEYPHLKLAEREYDTGVIVSFNTEDVFVNDSIIVPEGVKTYGINPLNWKTDSTVADKSLNEGGCFTDYSGAIISEIPNLTGAYIDEERGTLKTLDIEPSDYSSSLFPDGVYHLYDYQFFFRNLQSNVSVRTEAWFMNCSLQETA